MMLTHNPPRVLISHATVKKITNKIICEQIPSICVHMYSKMHPLPPTKNSVDIGQSRLGKKILLADYGLKMHERKSRIK